MVRESGYGPGVDMDARQNKRRGWEEGWEEIGKVIFLRFMY